jgi:hypothetical protein
MNSSCVSAEQSEASAAFGRPGAIGVLNAVVIAELAPAFDEIPGGRNHAGSGWFIGARRVSCARPALNDHSSGDLASSHGTTRDRTLTVGSSPESGVWHPVGRVGGVFHGRPGPGPAHRCR